MRLDSVGGAAVYEVQEGNGDGTASAILIGYHPLDGDNRLSQFNLMTPSLHSHMAADFDGDGVDEVAVTYARADTVMLEILDALDGRGRICSTSVFVGPDNHEDGRWDGNCEIAAAVDVDLDGYQEVMLAPNAGHDRLPRGLICCNWTADSVSWEYDIAGLVAGRQIQVIRPTEGGTSLLLFGTNAPSNGNRRGETDDGHSYAICLDAYGNERWIRQTGGQFTTAIPRVVHSTPDDQAVVIMEIRQPDSSGVKPSQLVTCDLRSGDILNSVQLPGKLRLLEIIDLDCDGQPEIVAVTETSQMLLYAADLTVVSAYGNARLTSLKPVQNYSEEREMMLSASLADGSTVILDASFDVLARAPEKGMYSGTFRYDSEMILLNQHRNRTEYYTLHKTPWTLIFSRYPILAFLAALIPLGTLALIVWYVLAIRQKNIFIRRQREAIDRTTAELQAAQRKLVEAEKYKQAQSIAGGVAHEIHNALFPALASLEKLGQRLQRKAAAEKRDSEMLDISREAVARGLKMTDLVKLYSRLESEIGDESVDLLPVIESALNRLESRLRASAISVSLNVPEEQLVRCKRIHLDSVLQNLLGNAIDAIENSSERHLRISARPDGDMIRLEVADTGCGISKDDVSRVFDVFFTTKPYSGTGLGLSVVKKIVDLYRGEITLTSVLDKGTNVTILLPTGRKVTTN